MNQFHAGPSQPQSADALFPGFPSLDLGRLWYVIRKRWWLASLVVAGMLGLAAVYLVLTPRVYEATAVIFVEPKNAGAVFEGIKGVKQPSWETLDALKSMADGISNGTVILRVVDALSLREDPGFLKPREIPYSDAEIVEAVSRNVKAELRRGTRLIDIVVRDRSPERAKKMAESFITEFQKLIREQNISSAEQVRIVLEEEAENQRRRVLAAEERIQEFRLAHSDVALDADSGIAGTKLEDLDSLLSTAENDVLIKRAQYDQYRGIPTEDLERVLEIGEYEKQEHIQRLLLARNEKRAEFYRIQKQFQPTHPTYQACEADLAGLEEQVGLVAQSVGESIENSYLRAVEHEKTLRATVQEQKLTLIELDGVKKEFRTLQRGVDAAYATYERLLDRINDAGVSESADETVVRVFSEPLVPSKAVAPDKKIILAVAGFFGICGGLALVLAIGLLDRTLHSRRQIESSLSLAVLAEIPKGSGTDGVLKDSIFVTMKGNTPLNEGIRSLRTSLSAHSPRSVLVTSASPGEGKSFCAANLAVLQAQLGYRTLLVDADFCRPQMAEVFIDPLRGTAASGALTAQNLCQPTILKELFLLSCGSLSTHSGEPMNGDIFAQMLQEAYASFDCVIIDTSPVLAVSDALTYARHADVVVLVAKSGFTEVDPARRAIRELQRMRANLVGCVLNGLPAVSSAQRYYADSRAETARLSAKKAGRAPMPAQVSR